MSDHWVRSFASRGLKSSGSPECYVRVFPTLTLLVDHAWRSWRPRTADEALSDMRSAVRRVNITSPERRYDPDDPPGLHSGMLRLGRLVAGPPGRPAAPERPPGQASGP